MSYQDTSHGTARPRHGPGGARNRDLRTSSTPLAFNRAIGDLAEKSHSPSVTRRLRAVKRRAARRSGIERAGATAPSTPMWTSRSGWLDAIRAWSESPEFQQVCASSHVSITTATTLSVAQAWASFADHATGRNAAVTRARVAEVAGCDPRTVTRAWKVLGAGGFAVEAARGHGSRITARCGNRASVWHLVSRKMDSEPVDVVHLPPSRRDRRLTPVRSNSPKARASARPNKTRPAPDKRRPGRATPRPLALQRLTAQLVDKTIGLDHPGRDHIGALCDAIAGAGINPAAWTAEQLISALNADMREHGWSWPNEIQRPAAFLAARLRRLPPGLRLRAPQDPHATRRDTRRLPPLQPASLVTASPDGTSAHPHATAAGTTVNDCCAVCGSPGAIRRPYLPQHRAEICDECWTCDS